MAETGRASTRARCCVIVALLVCAASPSSTSAQTASSHPDRAIDCEACHPCGGPATVNAPSCSACHDGDGTALGGATPPLTMGWSDPGAYGDRHGAAGNAAALDCGACHSGHRSPNAFVLASDGSSPAITREGVGAERLCTRCHATRHGGCATECHTWHQSDPISNGDPCFQCHGHDFTLRTFFPDGTDQPWTCYHCHGKGFRPSTQPPPTIADLRVVTGYDRARVVWRTTTNARGAVEWGAAGPTRTNANRWSDGDHNVLLTNLVEGATYTYRARASDVRRQVVRSAPGTFTPGVASAPRPILINYVWTNETSPVPVSFGWYHDTEPPGLPVVFQWQLAMNTSFDPLVASGETTGSWVAMQLPLDFAWYYRVRSRFTNRPTWSAWSTTGSFQTRCYDCH